MAKFLYWMAAGLALALSVSSVYTAGFGLWDPMWHRPLVFGAATIIVMINHPWLTNSSTRGKFSSVAMVALNALMALVIVFAVYRFIALRSILEEGIFVLAWYDWGVGIASVLVAIELTRRLFGLGLPIICLVMMLYTWGGDILPGFLNHAGYTLYAIAESIWFSTTGLFGTPMGILLSLVLVFIVFGALLEATGAGDVLLRFAFAATGRFRGGPAHAAIGASALFGTMSGSTIGNVVGTGTFTIPIIKRRGFPGYFAGGVESAASVGGQLVPPVMGAAAFLMADLTGTSYLAIATAALLPGLFYYASLFTTVGFEARRLNIMPIPDDEKVKLTIIDWQHSILFFGPIVAVVVALIEGRSPAFAGFSAIVVAVLLSVFNPEIRRDPMRLVRSLSKSGSSAARVIIVVGAIGIIIALMDLTGLGIAFANAIVSLGNQSLFMALCLTMLGCLILGMGMPTLPAYLIIVLVLGPAVTLLGVPVLSIHLFVFYFGVLANVTPPVALAAYAAAPIAGADPIRTGLAAAKLSLVGFIIPFSFIYEPQLLLGQVQFELGAFLWIFARLSLGIWMLAAASVGYEFHKLSVISRLTKFSIGIVLLIPIYGLLDIVAMGAGVMLLLYGAVIRRRSASISGETEKKEVVSIK